MKEIEREMSTLETELASNMPHLVSMMRETGERIVAQVKGETEAYVAGVAARVGFASLRALGAAAEPAVDRLQEIGSRDSRAEYSPSELPPAEPRDG